MNPGMVAGAVIVILGAAVFIAGVAYILLSTQRRTYYSELAPVKGSPGKGILWAFTFGMAPWAKDSARIHWKLYLRGILFHLGIFIGVAYLIASPWLITFPEPIRLILVILFSAAAVLMLVGFPIRLLEPSLRLLTTPDDYFSTALTTLFLASAAASVYSRDFLSVFWILSGLTMAYAPFGKIRHFIYFFYARFFIGSVFGRRKVLEKT